MISRAASNTRQAGNLLQGVDVIFRQSKFFNVDSSTGARTKVTNKPTIPDAVMNYDNLEDIRHPVGPGFSEPDLLTASVRPDGHLLPLPTFCKMIPP